MKQVQFTAFGVPHEVASCVDVSDVGLPADGETVVDIRLFWINPADGLGKILVAPNGPIH
jgi:NADPH:quinone reductase-like Zn-dependent oxidoreductase